MVRYAAFLRAINVGGHFIKMQELRRLLEAAGLVHVETFIQSGNVIFASQEITASRLEEQIEASLNQALGYPVATFIRGLPELQEAAHAAPFSQSLEAGSQLYIAFLKAPPDETAVAKLDSLQNPVDALRLVGRHLYWLRRQALGETAISGAVLERAIKGPATVRNITTVQKMAQKYPV